MSYTQNLKPFQWSKLYEYLKPFPRIHSANEEKLKRFVERVFWILRSGAQWRMLPEVYGNWNVVYQRFADWADKGVWYKMLYHFADDPDMEYIMVDSTVLRAHACSAGASKKTWRTGKPSLRSFLWRVLNQDTRSLRCAWKPVGFHSKRGAGRRLQIRHPVD